IQEDYSGGGRFEESSSENLPDKEEEPAPHAAILYLVNECGKLWSLWKDVEFNESRRVLDASMKMSTRDGKGSGLRHAGPVPSSIEEKLWSEGVLGSDSPRQLVSSAVWGVGKHFALRGGSELRDLEYNRQIQLEAIDDEGGLDRLRREQKIVRAFHIEDDSKCIVGLYTDYVSHRPSGCCEALFLSCNRRWKPDGRSEWSTRIPIRRHTLASTVKSLVTKVAPNDSTRYTN
uniref:DUF3504 domain-containing protein n=1 Tax=Macrostomum lignano TaxID=282301 RepID=A0A1I8H6L5_9PLAT